MHRKTLSHTSKLLRFFIFIRRRPSENSNCSFPYGCFFENSTFSECHSEKVMILIEAISNQGNVPSKNHELGLFEL
jgi:hypothetical protein